MATTTLDRMARGGMYDHVGGGFHRYSTDARWLVPRNDNPLPQEARPERVEQHGRAADVIGIPVRHEQRVELAEGVLPQGWRHHPRADVEAATPERLATGVDLQT